MIIMKHNDRNDRNNRGAILVFVAITLVVLLGFLALVIDVGIGESGRSEEQTAVQNAALAAMSTYVRALKTPVAQRTISAQEAAQTSAERVISASNRISTAYRQNQRPSTNLTATNNPSIDGSITDGSITFGKMLWDTPNPTATPPAGSDLDRCRNIAPCFVPMAIPANTATPAGDATAIEIKTSSSSNPLKTIFGRIFGAARYDIETSAIATLIPQNYLFLVDLSPSIVDQSHSRFGIREAECAPPGDTGSKCLDTNWFINPSCFQPASAEYFSYDVDGGRVPNLRTSSPPIFGNEACFSESINSANCLKFPRFRNTEDTADDTAREEIGAVDAIGGGEQRRARRVFAGFSSWWANPDDPDANNAKAAFPPRCVPNGSSRSQNAIPPAGSTLPLNGSVSVPSDYRLISSKLGTDLVSGGASLADALSLVDFGASTNSVSADGDFSYSPFSDDFLANPEPLKSVLDATNDAMTFIKDRAVSADRFFLAGFDETILSARTTCRTGSADSCAMGETLVDPSSDSFAGFLRLTDVKSASASNWRTYSSDNPYHFLNRSFFPRQGYNTDIQLALWKAYQELAANPSNSTAKNLVFLITDGVANCRYSEPEQIGPNSFANNIGEYLANRVCDGNPATIGQTVIESIRQMNTGLVHVEYGKTLVQLFKEKNIAVSVILIGRNVAPHYLIRPSTTPAADGLGTGGCLNNSEAVFGNIPFVNWNTSSINAPYERCTGADCVGPRYNSAILESDARAALINPTGNIRLPISNLLYEELVAPTKGAWIPIIEPLINASGVRVNFSSQLTASCNARYLAPTTTGVPNSPIMPNLPLVIGVNGPSVIVTDSQGRLLYDPYGRTQKEQIIEQVKQVLGGGFVLIEPLMRVQ